MKSHVIVILFVLLSACGNRTQKESVKVESIIDTKTEQFKSDSISSEMLKVDSLEKKTSIVDSYVCECFLLDSSKFQLFDEMAGNVSETIENDIEGEMFWSMQIVQFYNDWVELKLNANEEELEGWALFGQMEVAVYSTNYTNDTLSFYAEPRFDSPILDVYPKYFTEPMFVTKCEKKWLYVTVALDDKVYSGWVLKKFTCPNPYSTCN